MRRLLVSSYLLVLFILVSISAKSTFAQVLAPSFPPTPEITSAESPFNYGIAVTNLQMPDGRGDEGTVALNVFKSDLSFAGVNWIRADVTPRLGYSYFQNQVVCVPTGGPVCMQTFIDVDKLEGYKVLGVIDHLTVNYAQSICGSGIIPWTPDFTGNGRAETFSLEDWELVVDCVSEKFAGKIEAYEIWNEPLEPVFQMGYQNGSPENYFQMLKSAYEIIKVNDPNATVVGLGGLMAFHNGRDTDGDEVIDITGGYLMQESRDFSDELILLGGVNYTDVISVHGYDWGWTSKDRLDNFESNINYYKDSWNKSVWVTEAGFKADSPDGRQTDFLQYAYSSFLNSGASKIFWFAWKDFSDPNLELAGAYGIVGRPVHQYMSDFIATSKSGLLKVSTQPAVDATIIVEKENNESINFQRQWGIDWERLQVGQYKVKVVYNEPSINGKTTVVPSPLDISIDSSKTTHVIIDLTTGQTRTDKIWEDRGENEEFESGLLRVETNPAAGLDINVSSISDSASNFNRQWGVDWDEINVGDYEISFDYPHSTINGKRVVLPISRIIRVEDDMTTNLMVDATTGQVHTSVNDPSVGPTYNSGRLRVATNPPSQVEINVSPNLYPLVSFSRFWGVDWEMLEAGSYSVIITPQNPPLGLFINPVSQTASVSPQQITQLEIDSYTGQITTSYYPE